MIVREFLGTDTVRTYSDKGVLIHGGFPEGDYVEAIDPIELNREYVETDIPIENPEAIEAEYAEAGKILLGVEE